MTSAELLSFFDHVRPRGPGRWSARCPAHDDRSPSLSITEGERGLLLKCWSGCSIHEICRSLGIEQRELFFDAFDADPRQRRAAAQRRAAERLAREKIELADGATIDALKAADYFARSRRELDISQWSNQRLADELDALADGYALLEKENLDGQLG
jgi:hypothetical protein